MDLGKYCQVYENTTNSMTPRSVGGILLRPKNDRGHTMYVTRNRENNSCELMDCTTHHLISNKQGRATCHQQGDILNGV